MSDQENYIEASIKVPKKIADAVCNFIIENISAGLILEEEEKSDFMGIKFYIPQDDDKKFRHKLSYYFNSLNELHDDLGDELIIKERVIQNVEWEKAYKDSVEPIIIADDICIRPPWDVKIPEAKYDIIIEPKMAFGTGTHETTRSCLKLIRDTFNKDKTFLDVGCGSGILSVLAHQMGASYIKAIDYDKIAIENTIENFKINSVKCPNNVVYGTIEKCRNDEPYDFVCANIIKITILEILDDLLKLTKPNGYLLISGLLDVDEEEIEKSLGFKNIKKYEILKDNEWSSFIIKKRK